MDERRRETTLVLDKRGLKKITNLLISHENLYCYANSLPIIVKFEHLAKVFDLACYYPEELVCFAYRIDSKLNEENDMNEEIKNKKVKLIQKIYRENKYKKKESFRFKWEKNKRNK